MRPIIFLLCVHLLMSTEPALAGAVVSGAATTGTWVAKARVKTRKKRKRRRRKRQRSKRSKKKSAKPVAKPVTPQSEPKTEPKPVQAEPAPAPTEETTNSTPSKEAGSGSEDLRLGVAVMPMHALHGVKKALADLLSEVLLTGTARSEAFKSVIGGSDLQEIMSLEQQKGAFGCSNDGCLATLGGALGVPRVIVGSIGKLGQRFLLNIKLIDVEEAKVLMRVNQEVNSESELKQSLEQLVGKLLKDPSDAPAPPAPKVRPKVNKGMVAAGVGIAGIGVLSTVGSLVLKQRALSTFSDSNQTLGDYDQGLETTYYANTALAVGLSAALVGGILLSVTIPPWLSVL
jgi:TolB-like protein